jgi:hypothetical protein
MAKKSRVDESREPGGYCALPWCVIDSQAYQSLRYPAVALLIELARQYVRNNNGRLLLSENYLRSRQWRSKDVIERARRELVDAKLIYQTVQGHRPNKASWYALTWYSLDKLPGYDAGAVEGFRRGMYATFKLPAPPPTREALFDKWRGHGKTTAPKIDMLSPPNGVERPVITPAGGVAHMSTTPAGGAIRTPLPPCSTPANGHHLDKPLSIAESVQLASLQSTVATRRMAVNDPADEGGQIDRVRDHDLDPTRFDPATGEYFAAPAAQARHQKQAADIWVKSARAAMGR